MVADLGDQSVAVLPDHGRRLIAVVYADMVGYSRLIGLDDAGTFERLRELRRDLIDPAIARHGGTLVSTAGDSLLVRFDNIISAMRFAVEVQRGVPDFDGDYAPDDRMRFRMGVNVGDVIPHGTNLHGEGVNIAARLQSVCPPGAICVSRVVRDHVGNRIGLQFEHLGPLVLKNIAQPVEAFVLRLDTEASTAPRFARRRLRHVVLAGIAALLLAGGAGAAWWQYRDISRSIVSAPSGSAFVPQDAGIARAPRLSLVVLPFDNLDGTAEQNALADGITEDLTTALAQHWVLVVAARNTAFTYKGKSVDTRRVGNELSVRYAVEGSVRRVGTSLRVSVQLVSTESGAHLWAYQVDAAAATGGPGQDDLIWRISNELNRRLIDIEGARGARERPGNPDATDVLLQAYALQNTSGNPQQVPAIIALYERAVQLDPSSIVALVRLSIALLDNLHGVDDPEAPATLGRVQGLVAKAESRELGDCFVFIAKGYLLRWELHWPEATTVLQNVIDNCPNVAIGYHMLAASLLRVGRAAEVIPNEQRSIQLDPHYPWSWSRYVNMDLAALFLGRYDEAIAWAQHSLAAFPAGGANIRAARYAEIAAAHAFAGRTEEAHAAAAEANRLGPTMTVRSWWMHSTIGNPVFAVQVANVREGMRLAGVRDHADEDADFGVVSDDALHMNDEAPTPTTAPGARIVRTVDLVALLEQRKLLVLDVNGWGRSIPGAIGLRGAGIGGNPSDPFQARLGRKMEELTHGDRTVPIVTMAWNADRYSGRNLALRLVALGYTDVIWYRGGREAWEAAGELETEVVAQEW
jgi:adenylate cyclase